MNKNNFNHSKCSCKINKSDIQFWLLSFGIKTIDNYYMYV